MECAQERWGSPSVRGGWEVHAVCWLQEFQVVLGSPQCQEVPWQAWVKETGDCLEGSPLLDSTKYLADQASWGVWRIWRCGLKWEGKRIWHIGQITFSLGSEVLYQEVSTVSKLSHLKAKQQELQDVGVCGMHVVRVNGMWQVCVWGCGMPWSCTVSLLACDMPQNHEQVDENHARLHPLPEACCIPYPLKRFCTGNNFLVAFLHCRMCKLPERHWFMWTRHHHPALQTRPKGWLIGGTAVACDMLPTRMDSPSLLANDLGLH